MDAIIGKIKKLLALSSSSNVNEAALAACKMQELLVRHNLDLDTVSKWQAPSSYLAHEESLACNRLTKRWKSHLCSIVAHNYFCTLLSSPHSTKVMIVGQKHNIEVVRYLYAYLEREIERLASVSMEDNRPRPASYIRSFCLGAAYVIGRRLAESKKSMDESEDCRALLVKSESELELAVKRIFGDVRSSKRAPTVGSEEGFRDGVVVGREIPLCDGVAEQERSHLEFSGEVRG